MAKCIYYKFKSTMLTLNENGEEVPKDFIGTAKLSYSEENKKKAKSRAYNGEYTIKDDGQPESIDENITWDAMAEAIREGVNEI